MKKSLANFFGITALIAAFLYVMLFVNKEADEAAESFEKITGLECRASRASLFEAFKEASKNIICEDLAFELEDGRNGTSKAEAAEQFFEKYREVTEQAGLNVYSVAFKPAKRFGSFPPLCYFHKKSGQQWYMCKSKTCTSCKLDYPIP